MKVLIDNGHGIDTPGKCSPDGLLKEYEYNRRLAAAICAGLTARGISIKRIVTENHDVCLRERVRRVNAEVCNDSCLLVSVHVNAGGCGNWVAARGWSAFTCLHPSVQSMRLARLLTHEAEAAGLSGNRRTPDAGFWRADLAICRDTRCPAVLTENMFMDNREDLTYLLSDNAVERLADIHISGILNYMRLQ